MEVPLHEFKAQASRYIERASKGEEIIVTKRGKPKARITSTEQVDLKLQRQIMDNARKMREKLAREGRFFTIAEINAAKAEGRK